MNKIFLERTKVAQKRNTKVGKKLLPVDNGFLAMTTLLIIAGLIFTYSSSAFDSLAYFKRQVLFDILGVGVMLFLSQTFTNLIKIVKPIHLLIGIWVLLIWVLCLPSAAHVHRWINLGFFNLQPSELAKAVLIIYLSWYFAKNPNIATDNVKIITPLALSLFTIGLIIAGKDLGIPALMFAVTFAMFFLAGAKISKLFYILAAAVPVAAIEIYRQPYRLKRLTSFLSPEEAAGNIGYQLVHSFYAIGSGGWFGKGLGGSDLKLEYLPAAHTDFIFAIMCEEIGMIGAFFVIGVFIWLLVRGITLARMAKNPFNAYIMAGITVCLTLQAFFNMCVATGLFPTKGLPLPFFSYGGSSVIVTLAMMGILMNVAAVEKKSDDRR